VDSGGRCIPVTIDFPPYERWFEVLGAVECLGSDFGKVVVCRVRCYLTP
jgi:hypothetical protein